MKFLLVAVNAKYIHSNPGVYSLKTYAESKRRGGSPLQGEGLPSWHVEIAEYTINNQMEQVLEDIYRRRPDAVGFSCYIWNIPQIWEIVRDLHKVLPETDIWVGGPEVSFDAPHLLETEAELLGVMKGEGEVTFSCLLEAYEKLGQSVRMAGAGDRKKGFWKALKEIAGLSYRGEKGELCDQEIRPLLNLDEIPFLYSDLEGFEHRIVYYESSRGCPFSCSYCLSSIDKTVRLRSAELVKRELDFFLEKRVPQVKFVDRTFNCRKDHAMAVWTHILEHDNGITNFHFEIAADLLDQEELELIARMRPGLIQLEIGVQSTNPDTIREIRRRMDLVKVAGVVAALNCGANVHQHLDLIAGLPYEDYESFRASFCQVYRMEPEQLQLGFLKVLKGSYMYENAARYGLVYRDLPPYEVLSTKWLDFGEILKLKGVEQMVELYYNSRQFTKTLAILEQEFEDEFSLYEELAAYYDRRGIKTISHSRVARYEILYDFICEHTETQNLPRYRDALIQDLYLRENCKSRPSFAPDQTPFKEEIRRSIPNLRNLGSLIHPEVLSTGELMVFDYRRRDPLSQNVAVWEKEDYGKA